MSLKKSTLVICALCVFILPRGADAHVPNIVAQDSLKDIDRIVDPTLSQAFYGELSDFPHTFEIRAEEPFTLYVKILQPDIDSSKNNISGIIIKERAGGGRVEEVARLRAKDASWETFYEFAGGDTYRDGPLFDEEVGPGVYRIEVHTPDNLEKYVLVVGKREEMTIGYFELIGRLMEVKTFFEKSKVMIIQSPFVYVPTVLLMLGGYGVYLWRRRKQRLIQ